MTDYYAPGWYVRLADATDAELSAMLATDLSDTERMDVVNELKFRQTGKWDIRY